MSRLIHEHKVNPANEALNISVQDSPGSGGASHLYRISGFDTTSNPSCPFQALYGKPATHSTVIFQNGPIGEAGVNGVTHEALLAIVIDRLRSFQEGPYCSRLNALALTDLESAMNWLNRRTLERVARGVEGTHNV